MQPTLRLRLNSSKDLWVLLQFSDLFNQTFPNLSPVSSSSAHPLASGGSNALSYLFLLAAALGLPTITYTHSGKYSMSWLKGQLVVYHAWLRGAQAVRVYWRETGPPIVKAGRVLETKAVAIYSGRAKHRHECPLSWIICVGTGKLGDGSCFAGKKA